MELDSVPVGRPFAKFSPLQFLLIPSWFTEASVQFFSYWSYYIFLGHMPGGIINMYCV